jgi:hypothetical protein
MQLHVENHEQLKNKMRKWKIENDELSTLYIEVVANFEIIITPKNFLYEE